MVRACNFLRYFYVYLRHLLNIPIPDNYVFVFPKYIRFCKIYSWMSCQEIKPMLYYAFSKNKFVILNENFFQTDLHLSKIVHIILDMSYEQFSYQAEQKS